MTFTAPRAAPSDLALATGLARHGGALALAHGDEVVTYDELAARVAQVAETLGPERRVVALSMSSALDPVVTYLAALAGGHVALLCDDDPHHLQRLAERWDADVVASTDLTGSWSLQEVRSGTCHQLHPDLALLMSTSGSTGSPKLVRLSRRNLASNAAAIASYLRLRAEDRAITSLPLHYCYGLSVLNSHLHAGGGVVLTGRSVVDRCFWEEARRHRVTGVAGVPHTFELLERSGFDGERLPSLRYLTQAGGRMQPERVRRFAELGRQQGWDLYVMYGQTEATARIAYLPPELALEHPGSIGIAVPGGRLDLRPVEGQPPEVGELVYRGDNVMMGYASDSGDLASGPTLHELHTGDLARRDEAGLFEIVGRLSRFVKPFGLRVDLDETERLLQRAGIEALCAGDDRELALAVLGPDGTGPEAAAEVVRAAIGLPKGSVLAARVDDVPRTSTGKPDQAALLAQVRAAAAPGPVAGSERPTAASPVASLYEEVLGRPVTPEDTFVGLGGDSLSYVEVSLRLEDLLGHLPGDWHELPVAEVEALTAPARRRRLVHQVETGVVVRAVAITLVVGTHAGAFRVQGGAHVLLALAGANFARFQLRSGAIGRSILRLAVPSMLVIGALALLTGRYDIDNVLLLHSYVGPAPWDARWRFWFVEALVQILVVLALVLWVPAVRRAERAAPFLVPLGLLAASLLMRFDVVAGGEATRRDARPHTVLWLFALGWLSHRADTTPRRLLVSGAVLATVPGFFGQPAREAVVAAGLLLLLWVPTLPVPRRLIRPLGAVAGASLYTYLTHWHVYPALLDRGVPPVAAVAASLAVGYGAWVLAQRAIAAVEGRWQSVRPAVSASGAPRGR